MSHIFLIGQQAKGKSKDKNYLFTIKCLQRRLKFLAMKRGTKSSDFRVGYHFPYTDMFEKI